MHKTTHFMATIISAICIAPLTSWAQTGPGGPPELPPARPIPGINAEDLFPGACVDCHINYTDMNLDTRFGTIMAQWSEQVDPGVLEIAQAVAGLDAVLTGVHPRVDWALGDIPAACLACHRGEAGVPLVPLLHKIHFSTAGEAVFLRAFQGECTHCHKLDQSTGQWRVPSGPEQ